MVKIKFFGILTNKMPKKDEKGYWVIDGKGKTIKELLDLSLIKEANVKYTVLVNNERKDTDYILEDDDIITVIPLLAGG
jgi:ThiS family.